MAEKLKNSKFNFSSIKDALVCGEWGGRVILSHRRRRIRRIRNYYFNFHAKCYSARLVLKKLKVQSGDSRTLHQFNFAFTSNLTGANIKIGTAAGGGGRDMEIASTAEAPRPSARDTSLSVTRWSLCLSVPQLPSTRNPKHHHSRRSYRLQSSFTASSSSFTVHASSPTARTQSKCFTARRKKHFPQKTADYAR